MAELRSIATDLYGRPLSEFIAARKEAADGIADQALAKQVRALRKPSAAAWAVNALVRERAELVEEILGLGDELRDAQSDGDGTRTRLLDRTRRELTAQALEEAEQLAKASGGTLSGPAATGVEETLRAAMTDPDAGDAVLDGLLVTPFAASPFEPVDLSGALALPPEGTRPRTPRRPRTTSTGTPPRQEAATSTPARKRAAPEAPPRIDRKRVAAADEAVQAAEDTLRDAADEVAAQDAERERLQGELAALRKQMAQLERAIGDTEREIRLAAGAVEKAERTEDKARRTLDRARERRERLG
jgi:hypothetical protein